MCLECGTALNVSTSEVADQERAFIARADRRRARPSSRSRTRWWRSTARACWPSRPTTGFDLTAWLVPLLAALGALAIVVFTARRWRRARGGGPDDGGPALDADDARRLDAELAAFDR